MSCNGVHRYGLPTQKHKDCSVHLLEAHATKITMDDAIKRGDRIAELDGDSCITFRRATITFHNDFYRCYECGFEYEEQSNGYVVFTGIDSIVYGEICKCETQTRTPDTITYLNETKE